MRKIFAMCFVLLMSCAVPALANAGTLHVAVGVAPVEYFAKKIGGGLVQVTQLVPGGADAHTYEPKPSQMRAIAVASVYLSTGLEFEEAWEPRLKGANPKLLFVHTDAGLQKMPMPEGHEHHEAKGKAAHGHEEELDPHVWVAPSQARLMAVKIAEAFSKADPANAKTYAANLKVFIKEIDALDGRIKALFRDVPPQKRSFMVFHPAWGYFARDYGLTQTAIEFEGKEPTPRHLAAIVTQAKAKGTKVIFVQPQMSRRTASVIAQAIGGKLVEADPLAENWEANLLGVATSFRQGLQ